MRRPIVLLTFITVISIILFDTFIYHSPDIMENSAGKTVTVTGTVLEATKKDDKYYTFKIGDVSLLRNGTEIKYDKKLLIKIYKDIPDYRETVWSRVCISGEVSLPKEQRNPKTFDYRRHLKSLGIYAIITANDIEEISKGNVLTTILNKAKVKTASILSENVSERESAVIMGMLFGERNEIDEDILDMFRRGGTAHILSVSGLHLGILYRFLSRLRGKRKNILFDILIAIIVLSYAALSSFTPSATRATLMIFTHMVGKRLSRPYDFTSSICLSMLIILGINPMQIYNVGFQMSFLAMFTLAVLMPVLKYKIKGVLLPSVAIQIGTVPYNIYTFNYVSLTSVISNIPIFFITAAMIPVGILMTALNALPFVPELIAKIMGLMSKILIWCNEFTFVKGALTFDVVSPSISLILIYYFLIFFIFSEMGRIKIIRKEFSAVRKIICIIIVMSLLISMSGADNFKKTQMVFVDVGQGDCLHIKGKNKNILIDGGGSFSYNIGEMVLKEYLLKNGVSKIDMAIATHMHTDHYKGLKELSQVLKIDTLGVYESNKVNDKMIKNEFEANNILYLKKGDRINVSEDTFIEVISPEGGNALDLDDENKNSLVLRVWCRGVNVLMTGDIDEKGEEDIAQNSNINSQILKISHHGSKESSSDSFLEKVSPKIAILQVGRNNYGHPSPEVINKLLSKQMKIYRNDTNGAIGIRINKKGEISITTMIN